MLPAVLSCVGALAHAQDYKGPITLVVGYPPGGQADIGARILAERLPALLGQTVIVDNRAGAGGQIAARFVRDAGRNGTVLFFTNGHTVVTVPRILKSPGFNTQTDLRAIAPFASYEVALVAHPKTEARSVKDLVSYFQTHPAERNMAVPAPGSAPEFIVGRFSQLTNSGVQPVAYKGSAPAVQDLLGGQVAAAVLPIADVLQHVVAGKLRALAVSHATSLLPGVASFADAGLAELAASDFLGVYGPAALPDAQALRYSKAIRSIVSTPEVANRIRDMGAQPAPGTPQDLETMFRSSDHVVRGLIEAVHYQPQ